MTRGRQFLLISEELEELLSLSDRVYVIYEGRIMGEIDTSRREPDEQLVTKVGLMMTGTPLEEIQKQGAGSTCLRQDRSDSQRPDIKIRFEPRLDEPAPWFPLVLSLVAIVVALFIGGIVISAAGGDPIRSYLHIAEASFGSLGVLSDTIVKATPIMLTALACSVAFRMKLWNIGAEGQFIMGAFGASAIILTPVLPAETSRWIFIPVMILAGMAAGAAWGFIPGYLKAAFNVNEIISSLMLNYIAVAWVNFWIFAVWTEGGFQMSPTFPNNAWLPRLLDYAQTVPAFSGLTTHLGLLLGVVAAILLWILVYRSRWGYEIRLIGDNAARGPLCRHQHHAQHRSGDDGLRRARRPGRHVRGDRRCAPIADFADRGGLRIHRHHRGLAGQAQPAGHHRRIDPVRRPDPCGPRDPTVRSPEDDPGNHPGVPDRQ